MTELSDRDNAPAVAAICECGRAVFVAVCEYMDDEGKREIGELAIEGYTIKNAPVHEIRQLDFGCTCHD